MRSVRMVRLAAGAFVVALAAGLYALSAAVPDGWEAFLRGAGPWAPALFVLLYAAAMCAMLPSAPATLLGGVLFGPYLGFGYVWLGAMLGSAGAFFLGRFLGRSFVVRHGGGRFGRFDAAAGERAFLTVFLLRLACMPLTPVSFALGVTRIGFGPYMAGTGLGLPLGTFALTYGAGAVRRLISESAGDALGALAIGLVLVAALAGTALLARKVLRRRGGIPGEDR